MERLIIKAKALEHFSDDLSLPRYETVGSAGADISACLGAGNEMKILPGQRALVPTGLCFEIPRGYEIQVRPRSGLSLKTGLLVVNSPGTIDSDYRGELKVILGNFGENEEIIHHGDRIAQLVVAPVVWGLFEKSQGLTKTKRAEGGFGSTGLEI